MSKVKHPQWILAVMRQALEAIGFDSVGVSRFPFVKFVEAIEPYCLFRQRNALEQDSSQPQLLPYAVLRQATEDGGWRYFPSRRTREGGEPKLWDLVTVAYAGHIDMADAAFKQTGDRDVDQSTVDVLQTITHAVIRELREEVLVQDRHGREIDLLDLINFTDSYINDNTVPVNTFHLAIMITIDIPVDATVQTKPRQGLDSMEPMQAWQLMDIFDQLESWTGMFVKSLYTASVQYPITGAESVKLIEAEVEVDMVAREAYQIQLDEALDVLFTHLTDDVPPAITHFIDRAKHFIREDYMAKWDATNGKVAPDLICLNVPKSSLV